MSNSRSQRPANRYGSNQIRPGLLPGLLGASAAIAGLWANNTEWMITVLFVVSIMSAILTFFCVQALRADEPSNPAQRRPLTESAPRRVAPIVGCATLLVVIVIVYNPVVPIVLTATGTLWQLAQVATGAVLFVSGVLVKTTSPQR